MVFKQLWGACHADELLSFDVKHFSRPRRLWRVSYGWSRLPARVCVKTHAICHAIDKSLHVPGPRVARTLLVELHGDLLNEFFKKRRGLTLVDALLPVVDEAQSVADVARVEDLKNGLREVDRVQGVSTWANPVVCVCVVTVWWSVPMT